MLVGLANAWMVKANVMDKIWSRMMTISPVTYVAQPGTASEVNRRMMMQRTKTARASAENAPVAISRRTAISSERADSVADERHEIHFGMSLVPSATHGRHRRKP